MKNWCVRLVLSNERGPFDGTLSERWHMPTGPSICNDHAPKRKRNRFATQHRFELYQKCEFCIDSKRAGMATTLSRSEVSEASQTMRTTQIIAQPPHERGGGGERERSGDVLGFTVSASFCLDSNANMYMIFVRAGILRQIEIAIRDTSQWKSYLRFFFFFVAIYRQNHQLCFLVVSTRFRCVVGSSREIACVSFSSRETPRDCERPPRDLSNANLHFHFLLYLLSTVGSPCTKDGGAHVIEECCRRK